MDVQKRKLPALESCLTYPLTTLEVEETRFRRDLRRDEVRFFRNGELVGSDAPTQARRCLQNVAGIVQAASGTLDDVVKVTVYLTDLAAFGAVNEVYAEFFTSRPPARAAVEVSALPKGALVAVEAVAAIERG